MPERPHGTVTFLFTDIEGSTRLLRAVGPVRYTELLARHGELIRAAIEAHGGTVVGTEGDALFAAFDRPRDGVAAAVDGQRALAAEPWPDGQHVWVRMGIHTAEATSTSEGYVGVGVHRAARISAAGHGGQILVSQATHDLLLDDAFEHGFVDLGEHRLKDLTESQRLFQLAADGLPERFPPLRTLDARLTNLPTQATLLVGREREVAELVAQLRRSEVHCLTLTGPGGSGKTRLALAVAAEVAADYPNGVFFVPLAAVTDTSLVLAEVAQAIGVNESAGQDLGAFLAGKHLLLVVDNLEHLVEAASDLARLLAAAPRLKILATSRERLRVAAEQAYPVAPLGRSGAVALFIERARSVEPDFDPSPDEMQVIGAICIRLDGLPLAVELAAARVGSLPLGAILGRLEQPLKLLKGGQRDAPDRHQALERTLAWSYDLLGPDERRLVDHVLAVVDDEQHVLVGQERAQVLAGALVDADRLRNLRQHE